MKQKIKIMNYKPELSDEEIQSYMDFNRVLENRKIALDAARKTTILKWTASILFFATMLTIGFFAMKEDRPSVDQGSEQKLVEQPRNSAPLAMPVDSVASAEKKIEKKPEAKKITDVPTPTVEVAPEAAEENSLESPVIEEGYSQAEPLNGYPDLYAYFNANLVYPASALKDSIQGVQTISFIINKDGSVGQIEVEESLGVEFEKESIRLIQNMPAWKPAKLDGKPVATRISLPITFQIQKLK